VIRLAAPPIRTNRAIWVKQNVSFHTASGWHTEEPDKSITSLDSSGIGAWLVRTAATVHLSGSYACQPQTGAFSAPHWAVAIPDTHRGTGEYLTGWNNRHCRKEKKGAEHAVACEGLS
jgi:hypothetical protein